MSSNFSLKSSIRLCKTLTRNAGSNFVPAFRSLPGPKRQAMEILYAFNRFTDDLADDEDRPETDRQAALADWADVLAETLGLPGSKTEPPLLEAEDANAFAAIQQRYPHCAGVPLLPAVSWIVRQFPVPREALFHVIEGVETDLVPQRFATFDDAADYCHMVATSVGFASLAVWGTTKPLFSPEVVKAAKGCGIAFQWTNVLRDLVEDYARGRLYLPLEELERVGLTENQFASLLDRRAWLEMKKTPGGSEADREARRYAHQENLRMMRQFEEKFNRLLNSQVQRCGIYFQTAATLENFLESDGRKIFRRMYGVYYRLYAKIARNPQRILSGRVRLSTLDKLSLMVFGR